MGIIDTIKNIFKQEEKPEPIQIEFSNLPNFIQNKEQENQTKNQDFLNSINQLIQTLTENLGPQINILENLDISEKKTEERVKLIVKQNLDNYINHLNKLIKDFEETKEHNPESMINKINQIFNNFEKNSAMSYQKATFIVGKEIGDITNTLANFSKNFQTILKENKNLISTSQTLNIVKDELHNFKEQEKTKEEINNKMKNINREIEELKSQQKSLNNRIKNIKESEEYKTETNNNQTLENQKKHLQNKILELKQLIDFKSLASYCHSNEREMEIIKRHKENFIEEFQKDDNIIFNLLNQAKLSKPEIEEKAEDITKMQSQIKESDQNLELKSLTDITIKESEITKIKGDIEVLLNQLNKDNKRIEKIQIVLNDIKEEIKQIMHKIRVEIISLNM